MYLNRVDDFSQSSVISNSKAIFISSDNSFVGNLRHSASEAVEVVKFVAYGGMLPKNQNDENTETIAIDIDSNNRDIHSETSGYHSNESGSIVPFDLSVNHLKLITHAPGKPPLPPLSSFASFSIPSEDFLPVVCKDEITFRWRHYAREGRPTADAARVRAYKIVVKRFVGCDNCGDKEDFVIWDSDRVDLLNNGEDDNDLPTSIRWPEEVPLQIGQILEWRVTLWDMAEHCSTSAWSKFAVGPKDEDDWVGEWVVHPTDMASFDFSQEGDRCERWYKRRPLPLFRGILSSQSLKAILRDDDPLVSALLVVSGLGSFRATFDGVPLSPSGPIDPPFTDYSQRVSYRGFDVTNFMVKQGDDYKDSHVVGITMGSGKF